MQHWAQDYWRDEALERGDEGKPFFHTASNQFGPRGLQPGDRLYVVGLEDGQLLLIGCMDVEHVVRTPEAEQLLGESHLFPRDWHAIARPPLVPLSFRRRVPKSIARQIRSEDGRGLSIDPVTDRVRGMGLVTGRFIDQESARLLDALLGDELAESEEVRDVGSTARGRPYSNSMTSAQRIAVESHAVEQAIQHFESERWDVDDVGLFEPYDLHCEREGEVLRVEVKGSTQPLGTIALTAGEVEIARRHYPNTALFVVHNIKLDGTSSHPRPRGGHVYLCQPWRPKPARLRAIAYSYRLSHDQLLS